jgi:hypothetical protein
LLLAPIGVVSSPQDQVVFIGGSAQFGVSVEGAAPLGYQWKLNGLPVAGATDSTLELTGVQPAQAGAYSVEITNPFGFVTGGTAALSVLPLASWGDLPESATPLVLTNVVAIAAGDDASALAVKANGEVVAWGVGTPASPGPTNIVAVACGDGFNLALRADDTVIAWGTSLPGDTNVLERITNAVAIAARSLHALVLTADGAVVDWGQTDSGPAEAPTGLGDVVALAAGENHSLALRSDGTVAAWGDNTHGQATVPAGLKDVVAIAAGDAHSLALGANGEITAWGYNDYGESDVPSGQTNVIALAGTGSASYALRADGTVSRWGDGDDAPVGLTNVVAIAGGGDFVMALIGNHPPILNTPVSISNSPASGVSVSVPTACGRVYRLEYKNALTDATWTPLPLVAGNGGARQLTGASGAAAQRFYRVRRW